MKTKEFTDKVKSLGYVAINDGHQVFVSKGPMSVARINVKSQQTRMYDYTFGSQARLELLKIIAEYTLTPKEEREVKS